MCPYEAFPCFLAPLDGSKTHLNLAVLLLRFLLSSCSLCSFSTGPLGILEYRPLSLLPICLLQVVIWRFWLLMILNRAQGMWCCGLRSGLVPLKSAFWLVCSYDFSFCSLLLQQWSVSSMIGLTPIHEQVQWPITSLFQRIYVISGEVCLFQVLRIFSTLDPISKY